MLKKTTAEQRLNVSSTVLLMALEKRKLDIIGH